MKMNKGIISHYEKPLYVATIKDTTFDDYNNEIVNYNKPIYLGRQNYQPLIGKELYAYMSAYGETHNKLIRVFLDLNHKGKLDEFDLAYLYGATPNGEEIYGENANYIVKVCVEQNTKIMVIFEEIIKEEN